MDRFRNINYPYANDDDTFIARGYHLNQIVDEINDQHTGIEVPEIPSLGSTDIVLGRSDDVDSATVQYKAIFDKTVGSSTDQSGTLVVNNSLEETLPDISWSRESVNHASGSEEIMTVEFLKVGIDLVLRITNTSGNALKFIYTFNTLKYVS